MRRRNLRGMYIGRLRADMVNTRVDSNRCFPVVGATVSAHVFVHVKG